MALDDYMSSESAVVAGVTAAVLSPRVRGVLRRGAVYGVAGALTVGDAVVGMGRGAARGVRQAGSSSPDAGTGAGAGAGADTGSGSVAGAPAQPVASPQPAATPGTPEPAPPSPSRRRRTSPGSSS